jgi:hypothetical protein
MKYITSTFTVLAILLISPHIARAQGSATPPDSPWSFSVNFGMDNPVSGNLIDGGIGTLNSMSVVIDPSSYGDVYGNGVQWRFNVGYMLKPDSEVLGSLLYGVASGEPLQIGTATAPLFGDFSDHQQLGIEGGYRKYLTAHGHWRPYVGGTMGLMFVDRIQANFTVPDVGTVQTSANLYDNTTAFTFSAHGGVLYEINPRFGIGGELGLRWRGGLSEIDDLQGSGLEKINDNSDSWTLPFGITARFRF